MNRNPGIERIEGKRGKRYKVRFRDSRGRQTSRTFGTLQDAQRFKSELDRSRYSGGIAVTRADQVTFAEYAEEWVAHQKHRPNTAKRRDGILRVHLLPPLGHLTLDKIRRPLLETLVEQWEAAGLKPHTIRNHVQILRSIFRRAVRDEILLKNPATDLDLPKANRSEVAALSPDEFRTRGTRRRRG